MTSPLYDMFKALAECQESLKTCAVEAQKKVVCRLAFQLSVGLADLTASLTDEDAGDVAGCQEDLTEAIKVCFMDAEDAREKRRETREASRADYAMDAH